MVNVQECVKSFKRIYPERDIRIIRRTPVKNSVIIKVAFPDETCYFITTPNSVSAAYDSFEDAKRDAY